MRAEDKEAKANSRQTARCSLRGKQPRMASAMEAAVDTSLSDQGTDVTRECMGARRICWITRKRIELVNAKEAVDNPVGTEWMLYVLADGHV